MTTINVTEIGAGRRANLTVDAKPGGGAILTLDVTEPAQPEPPAPPFRLGMEGPNGQPTRDIVAQYAPRYMRDFGAKINGESLPSLTDHGTGKLADMPLTCIPHVSWKTDVMRLGPWLDGLTRPVYLTWYHEPMGDVSPATYRNTASKITTILAGHPNAHLVLGHGPIITRYWLDEGKGDPMDWWYPGANIYGIDWYEPNTSYKGAPALRAALDKVRTALPGVRVLVPEYGLFPGAGRADAIERDVQWFRAEGIEAVAYWNSYTTKKVNGVDVIDRDYRITWGTPESMTWNQLNQS